jgi:serine/threonine protein kinase
MTEDIKYSTLPLKVIRGEAASEDSIIYLVMSGKGTERQPIILGTGRNAVVFLGNSTENLQSRLHVYYAIKFLKDDPDAEYARVAEERFFVEIENTQSFGQLASSFVKYNSGGAILDEKKRGDKRLDWEKNFSNRIHNQINIGEEYSTILESYFLQGPFYAVELCQATLYDLLERDIPWIKLPVYDMQPPRANDLPLWKEALEKTRAGRLRPIKEVINAYFDGDIYGKSGYDILNSVANTPEANRVRNYTVLELFEQIVRVVRDLHSHKLSLVHRDLKPGNLFLVHDANFDGIGSVDIKLGDLGFTAAHRQLDTPSLTLHQGIRNPAAQTPGSQFYRAPEQAELPVEVRVSFDKASPDLVRGHGSKISNIQVGDHLVIGDPFKKGAHRRTTDQIDQIDQYDVKTVFKINEVAKGADNLISFKLDSGLTIDNNEDIWANIVRATGYHTDGYTLGAILYDLVSGGRNPEAFYTYCLVRFIEEFSHIPYSINDIVEALAPSTSILGGQYTRNSSLHSVGTGNIARATPDAHVRQPNTVAKASLPEPIRLSWWDRLALAWRLVSAKSAEQAVSLMFKSSLDTKIADATINKPLQPGEQLLFADKWEIIKGIIGADYIDHLLDAVLQSPLDVKMRILGTDISTMHVAELSIEEKWSILNVVMKANTARDLIDSLLNSVLNQAILRDGVDEAVVIDNMASLNKKWDYLRIVMKSTDLEDLIEDIVKSAHSHIENSRMHEWLRNYRFRTFHLVSELLTDKRGVPIPADIIRIIVKCMLRNISKDDDRSYYNSSLGKGFLTDDNVNAVHNIHNDTLKCLADENNQPPPGFPADLKENLLFNLRSMAPQRSAPGDV